MKLIEPDDWAQNQDTMKQLLSIYKDAEKGSEKLIATLDRIADQRQSYEGYGDNGSKKSNIELF